MAVVEISIRRFFISDEADVSPKMTFVVPLEMLTAGKVDLAKLADRAYQQVAALSWPSLREMTPDEAEEYRANEDEA